MPFSGPSNSKKVNKAKTILTNLCRLILGATLIFSGYVKAIDPLGTQYKIQDYAASMGLVGVLPDWLTLGSSIGMSALEFCLGVFLLLAIRRRLVSKLAIILMAAMTLVTLWLALFNPIQDCGCFGDAIKLTNTQTFLKNIGLLGCAIIVAKWPLKMVRFVSKTNQWIAINFTVLYIIASSLYCLYTLPVFDFRPYRVGVNIKQGMETHPGAKQPKFETVFVMAKDGIQKEFTLENYPDSTWTYVDRKTIQTEEGYVPPIHDFSIEDPQSGEDLTDKILSRQGYTFLLIAPRLEQADDLNFGDINRIYDYAVEQHVPFYCLTSSDSTGMRLWQNLTGAEYPFYTTDAVTLKTIIRSNPGLMLLKNGTIIGKWSHNALPKAKLLETPLQQSSIGKMNPNGLTKTITKIVLWFFLPLLILILADRTWAWTKWIKHKKKTRLTNITNIINKKNMRKKIVAGNWKMNMNLQDGINLAKEINEQAKADKPNCDVVVCTPFIHLASVAQVLDKELVGLGAENCADKEKGAYTGEVSAEMVKSTGAQYVILGHSERRQYYNETPEMLKEKVLLALKNGLKVIFCCGETLEEREANKQNEVVKAELEGSVFNLDAEEWKSIILAYEPIWAIGTGRTATAEQAEEMLAYIRKTVAEKYGADAAEETSILYGGSCNAKNAPELFSKPNIDGGLIGGASLKAADFKGIIDAWKK